MTLKCNIYILTVQKPLTVMLLDGIINPGLMHLCAPVYRKGILFPIFLAFSTTEYAFSEGFEPGIHTSSDWRYCHFVVDTAERHTYLSDPLV